LLPGKNGYASNASPGQACQFRRQAAAGTISQNSGNQGPILSILYCSREEYARQGELMKRVTVSCLVLLAPIFVIAGRPDQQPATGSELKWRSALHAVVEAELAFARTSGEKGTKEAFLAFLAEDSILFRPQAVAGRKFMLEHPPSPGKLSWRPIFADVSSAGDLGYTTGPYEYRKDATDAVPASYGNYFTIWKKQPDGVWKVLIDYGTSNPAPKTKLPDFVAGRAKHPEWQEAPGDPDKTDAALIEFDRKLSSISAIQGEAALREHIGEDARFLRPESQPAVGVSEVRTLLTAGPGVWTWEPLKSGASSSGDLGYTYGTFDLQTGGQGDHSARKGYYLRVYKNLPKAGWKIVVDVLNF
jgi:ketosteroid isomerase-like protein